MILSIDLGKFNSVCCFYDTERRKHRFETIATRRAHVDHLLDGGTFDLVVMEACGPSGWISDQTDWDSTKLLLEVPPEQVKLKVMRPDIRPAGQLHCEQPEQPCKASRRRTSRRGSRRKAPVKT